MSKYQKKTHTRLRGQNASSSNQNRTHRGGRKGRWPSSPGQQWCCPRVRVTSEGESGKAPWKLPASWPWSPAQPTSVQWNLVGPERDPLALLTCHPQGPCHVPDHPDPDPAAQLFMGAVAPGRPASTSHLERMRSLQGTHRLHELNLLQSPGTAVLAETKLCWPLSKTMPMVMKA